MFCRSVGLDDGHNAARLVSTGVEANNGERRFEVICHAPPEWNACTPTITAHLENVNGSKEPRAVLLWRSGVLPYTKFEEANA